MAIPKNTTSLKRFGKSSYNAMIVATDSAEEDLATSSDESWPDN